MRETPLESPPASVVFAGVIERYQWPLYSFLRGLIGDDEQARDAVQDVYCDAWRANLRGAAPFADQVDEEGVRRWLFHTAYCRAASVLRRRRLVHWESLDAAGIDDAADEALALTPFEDRLVESEVVRAALARLSPDDVACLLLNTLEGYTAAQIAQI
ncbi:MAG: RNA polymerase sigma factor, partial [Ktedonobacterales bacterium]